jgi:hypothetical protein
MGGRIRSIEKSNDLIGNGTRNLPACSVVPEPTMLLRASMQHRKSTKYNTSTAGV